MKQTKYLVAIACTHGNNNELRKVSGSVKTLLQKYGKPKEDCMLLYLGDALPFEKIPEKSDPDAKEFEKDVQAYYKEFADALANAELPVVGVGGNYDLEAEMRAAFEERGWQFLHGETFEWQGLKFAGYGGSRVPGVEAAEEQLGFPQEKFVQFSDKDLVERLGEKEIDIFLHHTMPYGFVDQIGYARVMTDEGEGLMPVNIGAKGINYVLGKTNPILSICGHLHDKTASATEDRTVLIKCHGFQDDFKFPVYYVEVAYDEDEKPFVRSNVDISFELGEFGQLLPRPIVTCREEYECNSKEMVHHYRIYKKDDIIIKAIKTERGFKVVSQRPALLGADDISWAFAGDDKKRKIIEP